MPRYIDADKADNALHDLLDLIKQEKKTARNVTEYKRESDIAAGIVLAIYALRDLPKVDICAKTCGWVDDESMPNEDMIPDNELIGGW